MNLDEAVLGPVFAPSLLDGGLNLKDQVHLAPAKVEKTPVEALVDRGVFGDWANRVGEGDDF